ncbi:MAG TPA: phosphotransferase family protein [Anaeromyxobacteraceae bacterium]|nr:phosphotransferase family protein [Anaeromyxobacteraceae bacterium]
MDAEGSSGRRTALLDEPGEVRREEGFEPERLRPVLERAFPGARGPVTLLQFREGHSNLTYLVRIGGQEAVLRRAPFGTRVKSAHDMRREFSILSAIQGVYPRAPRPIVFCEDESLIGARFYLMERVRGVVLRGDASAPGLTPDLLRAASTALVDNLAELHGVDLARTGLASTGKPQGYVGRQVAGWTERYARARTDEIPQIEAVAAWLAAHLPPESGAALVHNDYKFDNVVLDPADLSRIVAVLDWEMATVGDPLMDLGTTLGYWADPDDPAEFRARTYGPTHLPGSLPRIEVVERYAERTGRGVGSALFYYAFALFKIAVIVQQIYRRYIDGHTHDPRFASLVDRVRVLGRQATRALEKERIHGLGAP